MFSDVANADYVESHFVIGPVEEVRTRAYNGLLSIHEAEFPIRHLVVTESERGVWIARTVGVNDTCWYGGGSVVNQFQLITAEPESRRRTDDWFEDAPGKYICVTVFTACRLRHPAFQTNEVLLTPNQPNEQQDQKQQCDPCPWIQPSLRPESTKQAEPVGDEDRDQDQQDDHFDKQLPTAAQAYIAVPLAGLLLIYGRGTWRLVPLIHHLVSLTE